MLAVALGARGRTTARTVELQAEGNAEADQLVGNGDEQRDCEVVVVQHVDRRVQRHDRGCSSSVIVACSVYRYVYLYNQS